MRLAARMLDGIIEFTLVVLMWAVIGDAHKIWTDLFLAFLLVWALEATTIAAFGTSPGKALVGLRVSELDQAGAPTWPAATRRGAVVGVLSVLPIIGWALWAASALGDALGRGLPDRASSTMVVPKAHVGTVTTRDLPGYADAVRMPRLTPQGRVADLDVRYRARLRRIEGFPVLAAAIGLLALAVSLPFATGWLVLGSSLAWVVIFIIHETRLVTRTGATPGHTMAGLVIVDRRTGRPPSPVRSFARALVLALTIYVPLLWLLPLPISLILMRFSDTGRGLHDYAGGTVVVADPRLAPEAQRQRQMRMRMGMAG